MFPQNGLKTQNGQLIKTEILNSMIHFQKTCQSSTCKIPNSNISNTTNRESFQDSIYQETLKSPDPHVKTFEEQNSRTGVSKAAQGSARQEKLNKRNRSLTSSSGIGTLSTIPEGKVEFAIPRPIWPNLSDSPYSHYDSLLDEAVLLYTSQNYVPDETKDCVDYKELSVKEILIDLLNKIQVLVNQKDATTVDEILKHVNDRILASLDALKNSTEDEMRKLSVNLSNSKKVSSVVRAFSNSSSSGNSSQCCPTSSSERERTNSTETEEIYEVPSGSSSSGFSDSLKQYETNRLFSANNDNQPTASNEVRSALIYGTLCRTNKKLNNEKLLLKKDQGAQVPTLKRSLLSAQNNKPSVWQLYYGVKSNVPVDPNYVPKPTDIPAYVS